MIAISSFRPLGQDAEYDRNQLAAKASWDKVFEEVIYFNRDEPKLETKKTFFIGSGEHPTIKEMCHVAAMQPDWACLINADIIVNNHLQQAMAVAKARQAWALVSYRWQKTQLGTLDVIDNGLDFFAAVPAIWKMAEKDVPAQLRLGHQTWDTWMIGYLNRVAKHHFYNITAYHCIHHPIHGGRRYAFNVDGALDGFQGFCGMPPPLMTACRKTNSMAKVRT